MKLRIRLTELFPGECESRITDLRARIPRQQDLIRTRRTEKQRLEEDARRLRAEADSAAIRGQAGMQLGMGNNSRRLLEEAERKMREVGRIEFYLKIVFCLPGHDEGKRGIGFRKTGS